VTTPACSGTLVCPATPAAATALYGPATLHIGAAASTETSRTYLTLAVTRALLAETDARLVLPIGSTDDGTKAPELARVQACLSTQTPPAVRGSFASPPAIDCAVSARAVYNPIANTLAIDLRPFLAKWSQANTGLALVPSALPSDPTVSWHIAIPARDHAGAAHIAAIFESSGGVASVDESAATTDEFTSAAAALDLTSPDVADFAAAPAAAPLRPASPGYRPAATAAATGGFMQPLVFLAPLLLCVVIGRLAASVLRPVEDLV
jgi:hypothetical protein